MSNLEKISKANNVKNVDLIYEEISKELAEIDILQYVKIYNGCIKASNTMSTNDKKEPIVTVEDNNIVGVELLFDSQNKTVQFFSINVSSVNGSGGKIVSAVLKATPKDWYVVILMDWSHGFWPAMQKKYPRLMLA